MDHYGNSYWFLLTKASQLGKEIIELCVPKLELQARFGSCSNYTSAYALTYIIHKHLLKVDHPNIVKFHGTFKVTIIYNDNLDPRTGNTMMILQFANNGNLRDYLKGKWHENKFKFAWNKLIKYANEITLGLKYLHTEKIIHRDLHSKNILINDDKILITDFGISKDMNETSTISFVKGMLPYIEPQCLLRNDIKRDKKSDIYSLGVLFWELTSGIPPFRNLPDFEIIMKIVKAERENVITGTPPVILLFIKIVGPLLRINAQH
ncbi:kinase-like domain-containing protein [Gigaspora rosea]|uniref:Kinase-like domain-containing protein n=1 Tax=Gigaspora rosea TaxID=44941 RepID=A0A397UXZ3_9GLOM|nr:kinase-like domain-containing protein [Gigaspora rosea]